MATINEQDLLDEIHYDIEAKDLLKAKLVLASLEHVSRDAQKKALFEVSRANDDFAIPLLAGVVANSPDISDSFPQIKETMFSRILDNPEILLQLLSDSKEQPIKKLLINLAGEIRLSSAVPILTNLLLNDPNIEIIKSVISALGVIGDGSAVESIAKFLQSNNPEVVETAIRVLGEIGTSDSIKRLHEALGNNTDQDLIILDIISKVQIPEALNILNDLLGSQLAHIRTATKQKLGEIGTMSVRVLTKNLRRDNPDLIIHSLNVLGDIGDSAAIPAIRKLLFEVPKDPNIRFAAYEALGRLPLDKGAFTLATGLEDPVDNVRSAAAKAVDRNYNAVLAGGVRNLIRSGDATALSIMGTLINSYCDKIFLDLLEEDFFKDTAINYLSNKAHPDTKSYYVKILSESGRDDIAGQITTEKVTHRKGKLKVFAVDDSKLILNIYRTVLHNLGCESLLFEFPAEALDHIKKEKPDVVLTDLNMPGMTGIELTSGIRGLYNEERLPIIMVTTQDETRDNKAAYAAGVNGILQKPFTEESIGKILKKFSG